jgi:hypothetical protein
MGAFLPQTLLQESNLRHVDSKSTALSSELKRDSSVYGIRTRTVQIESLVT